MTTDPDFSSADLSRQPGPGLGTDGAVHEALQALRARAEKRSQLVIEATDRQGPESLQRLVQELQVQQIELEMQYEELLLAQAEAQTARAQFVDLYDFAPVGYFTLGASGVIEQLNLCAAQQLGLVRQRLQGRRFALFVEPPDRIGFGQFLARIFSSDRTQHLEVRMRRDDNALRYVQLEGLRVDGAAGPQCRLVVLDVTQRREATLAREAVEARFRATFEQSNDGMILLEDLRLVDLNAAALRHLGLAGHDKPQALGQPLLWFWPERQPDGRRTLERLNVGLELANSAGWCRIELQRRQPDGREVWDELSFNPVLVQGRPLMHAVWRDITAARTAREQLRLSEERLQMALASSSSGIWSWDIGPDELHFDGRAQAIFGQPASARPTAFRSFESAIHPDDRARVQAALQHAIAERASLDLEFRIHWPDGTARTITAFGKVSYDAQGQPLHLAGIVRDVTQRRETQEQLRREKEFSESLLQNSIDGIAAFDRQGRVTAWNAEVARIARLAAPAVLGRCIFDLYPRFDNEPTRASIQRVLTGEQVALLGLKFSHREGEYDTYLVPLSGQGGEVTGILAIIRDVTERNRLAEEATRLRLRQQQEVLSAILETQETERKRIAEALHNGLGQVLYATKLSLEGKKATPAVATESVRLLNEAIRTTRTISFELTPGILEDFGLRIALEELVKRISPRHLPVHLHIRGLDDPLPAPVEIAVYRITQELLNNVLKHANATEVQVHLVRECQLLELSVEDNGRGFDAQAQASGPLSGIGLAGIRNRVALLGGQLHITSEPGRGTIVSIEVSLEENGGGDREPRGWSIKPRASV